MRKTTIALTLSSMIALIMVAQPVMGATITSVVSDPEGDVGYGMNPKTGGLMQTWPDGSKVAKTKYLDMVSMSLSQKGKAYAFGMELAGALPIEGTALPGGFNLVEWAMWIDPSPWNVLVNPVPSLYLIALRYDGAEYSCFILDYATMTTAPTPFSVSGSKLEIQFTAASINNLAFEWWSPLVRVWSGQLGTPAYWFVDAVNLPLVDGYVYIDLPWPPA